jgi:uncharacterized repeat protein (TIGR01451 family)
LLGAGSKPGYEIHSRNIRIYIVKVESNARGVIYAKDESVDGQFHELSENFTGRKEMDFPNKRRKQNLDLAAIATNILVAFLLVPTTGLTQEPYDIDGVIPDENCCVEFQDPVGSISELGPVNSSDTKLTSINTATPAMLGFTNPNSSTDIAKIWLETKTDLIGDIWLYFAWERDATTGSSVISYEFQTSATNPECDYSNIDQIQPISAEESALIDSCNPWSNRQAGDFMVVWDFGGGSTDIILRTFDGTNFDAGINLSTSGIAVAALSADTSRGEGAINLTDAIFGTRNTCFNVANVIPGTITGNSDSADYKDTVLADIGSVVTISNCGMVNITKSTQPAGETGNFSYTLQRLGGDNIDYTPRTSATGALIDDGGTQELIVIPGTDYQVTEDLTGEPSFDLQSIVCNKPAPNTDGMTGFSVSTAETTDCVITNELLTGTITVIKQVVNDFSGTAQASDFCIALNDDENTPAFPGNDTGTQFNFVIGNQYSVSEVACGAPDTSPPGYIASFSGECSGLIEARTDKVCTVTNTQQPQPQAGLTLFKTVLNDNGGTALSSAWTLNATLKAGSSGTCTAGGFSGSDANSGVSGSLSVSDNIAQCVYALSETDGPTSGYSPVGWTCSGDVALNGNEITIGSGGGNCTITNDDNAPSLTLVKQVINDNGGTSVAADWTLTAAGYDSASPDAGTYTLSESGPGGYSQTSLTCSNSGDAQVTTATLGLGDDVTCTFVNDDNAPSLTLVKQVINDNGGTLQAGSWTLSAAGPTPISGAGSVSSNGNFSVGTYSLSEFGPANYTASGWGCDSGNQNGNMITLSLGESATCTISNDDIQPVLTVVKQVINDNGGVLNVGDFPLFIGDLPVTLGIPNAINAGIYIVSETSKLGYAAGTWGGDCAADGSINLVIGDNKTCTITNDDIPPELKIEKSALGPAAIPGAEMAYSITVKNIGGGDALGVTLTDTLPPANNEAENLTPLPWVTFTAGCTVSDQGATLTCDVGTLVKDPTPDLVESGDEASFTVTLTVTVPEDYLDTSPDNPDGSGTLGSNFEIDGDLVDDNGTPGLDWGTDGLILINVLDPPIVDLLPDYTVDNAFTDGAKEDDPVPTVLDASVPPNKSDLTNFLIAQDEVNGNAFLALGWIRTDSLGTSNFDFELNQLETKSANGVTLIRTDGDVLIGFDFESSGNVVMLTLREWDGDAMQWGSPRTLNIEGTGFAAINDPELFDTLPNGEINPFSNTLMSDQSFGEALINLTQTFEGDCRKFLSAFVKGRSSTPFTAVLKDFIAPVPAVIDTCRTIDVLNEATADATNPGQDPVSDTASIILSNDPLYAGDPDEDGMPNYIDPDDDNDGVADELDAFPFDPNEWADTDGDGVGDNSDAFPNDPAEWADTDGDGVGDNGDAFPNDSAEWADTDGDGVGDNGDAFPNDPTETGDNDGDGIGNNADPDDDNDGMSDADEAQAGTDPLNPDTDGDGVDDNNDAYPLDPSETLDTDGDGVGDNGDAFQNDPTETADSDGDGVGDNADAFPNDPTETADSDDDGVGDNADAFPNDPTETADSDGDGDGDNGDAFSNDPTETADSDGDGIGDNADAFPNDPTETVDTDGDGVGDNADAFPNDAAETADRDGDGIGDNADAFPNDPTETVDTDGDGVGDNADAFPADSAETTDTDSDGIGDNSDAFPGDPTEWADSDGDGVGDNADVFPNDPNEWMDTDGDGVGDSSDASPGDPTETADSDDDGIGDNADAFPNDPTETVDTDGDGVGNNGDAFPGDPAETTDSDGDGVGDNADVFPNDPNESADTDGDGIGNNADAFPGDPAETTDSDSDGFGDNADAFPNDPTETVDTDGDGVGDNADAFPGDPTATVDTDGDGVGDNADAFPNDSNETVDTDGDGVGNNGDAFPGDPAETTDSDGDGVGDNADAFSNDPTETVDTDGDGVGDNGDAFPGDPAETTDSDGDGTGDNADAFPNDPTESTDSDGDGVGNNGDAFPGDPAETTDSDGDGVGNNSDAFPDDPTETADTDGDGLGDNSDAFPGDPAESVDTDGDGAGDNADAFPNDPTETADTDGDGLGDNVDLDNDNDGVGDNSDAFPNDPDESVDTDGDDVGDNADTFPNDPTETEDTDGDGLGNNIDPDDDNDGVEDIVDAFPNDPSESVDTDGDGIGDNSDTSTSDSVLATATNAQDTSSPSSGGGGGSANPLLLLLLTWLAYGRSKRFCRDGFSGSARSRQRGR